MSEEAYPRAPKVYGRLVSWPGPNGHCRYCSKKLPNKEELPDKRFYSFYYCPSNISDCRKKYQHKFRYFNWDLLRWKTLLSGLSEEFHESYSKCWKLIFFLSFFMLKRTLETIKPVHKCIIVNIVDSNIFLIEVYLFFGLAFSRELLTLKKITQNFINLF